MRKRENEIIKQPLFVHLFLVYILYDLVTLKYIFVG